VGTANLAAIVFALSSVPAFLIARSLQRGTRDTGNAAKARLDRRLSRLMEAVGVVELDEERKAQMVGNLLTVLCSDRGTQPVVNTGSLY